MPRPPRDPATRSLTHKELRFVQEVVAGKTQTEAWKTAYGKCPPNAHRATEWASDVALRPAVAAAIAKGRARIAKKVEDKIAWKLSDAVAGMKEIFESKPGNPSALADVTHDNRIRAAQTTGKWLGWEATQKLELSGGVSFLALAGRGAGAGTPEAQKLAEMLNAAAAALRGNEG